jgi:ABC-type branched-subunit amino acid transport system ATPase component
MTPQVVLETSQLSSGYGKVEIVHDANIFVEKGTTTTIVGPNGSGKSTLLKSIVGQVEVFRGKAIFEGNEITGMRTDRLARLGMGYVPQIENVFPQLTVEENLEMGGYIQRKSSERRVDIRGLFNLFVELEPYRKRKAGTLSGGERQMLAIARALMAKPRLLILDEPTANLAPKAIARVHEKIDEIKRSGVSILMVEQNARGALGISDKGYIMMAGAFIFRGPPKEVLHKVEVEKVYFQKINQNSA